MTDRDIMAAVARHDTECMETLCNLQLREEHRKKSRLIRRTVNACIGVAIAGGLLIAECAGMIAPVLVGSWLNIANCYALWVLWQAIRGCAE